MQSEKSEERNVNVISIKVRPSNFVLLTSYQVLLGMVAGTHHRPTFHVSEAFI